MQRYYVSTSDGSQVCRDEEGTLLPDTKALATMIRETLTAILHDEHEGRTEFWADALDSSGRRVMTARISLSIAEP